jgi:hypothetical protein
VTKCWFIDSTCFGNYYANHQEYNNEFRFLVSKPGKPSGLCSAGLLDVCTAQRMWPHPLSLRVKQPGNESDDHTYHRVNKNDYTIVHSVLRHRLLKERLKGDRNDTKTRKKT